MEMVNGKMENGKERKIIISNGVRQNSKDESNESSVICSPNLIVERCKLVDIEEPVDVIDVSKDNIGKLEMEELLGGPGTDAFVELEGELITWENLDMMHKEVSITKSNAKVHMTFKYEDTRPKKSQKAVKRVEKSVWSWQQRVGNAEAKIYRKVERWYMVRPRARWFMRIRRDGLPWYTSRKRVRFKVVKLGSLLKKSR